MEIKNVEEYEKIKSRGLVIVDYFTEWCGPCKKFAPIFKSLAEKYTGTTFISVNAEKLEHEDTENIKSIPTFKIFLNGKLRREFSGCDKERLEEYIQRFKIQIYFNGKAKKKFTKEDIDAINDYLKNYSENA